MGGCWGRVPARRSYPSPDFANSYAPPESPEIPINFVNSETPESKRATAMDENTAIVKIQAVFRGFCVRKPRTLVKLRAIMKIRAEAGEIRRRVNDENVADLIKRDENEGLKMAEWIMSLLLRLDGIQGAIPFVRGSRKAAISELLNLQQTVDDIMAPKSRQNAVTEVSGKSEAVMEEPFVEAIRVSVSNDKAEESLPAPIHCLQIEGSSKAVEIFKLGFSGTEECTMVYEDADNLKIEKVGGLLLGSNSSPKIPCTEEVVVGKSENSSDFLELLKADSSSAIPGTENCEAENSRMKNLWTIQADGKIEIEDFMDCQAACDKLPEKVNPVENIGDAREDNKKEKGVKDLI